MIFVTVGSHYQGFERLIKKMDKIAEKIDEKVIMQIGHTEYAPKNAEYFDFEDYEKIQSLNREARVVVCHGGVGSVITALEQESFVIVVPRLKRFGEVADDHQLEIAGSLAEEGKITVVHDVNDLEEALKDACENNVKIENERRLIGFLEGYIRGLKA
ncbi:MAG: PssE/Cps14G family polysaccharide biosynthesis glycosyltransferase [Halobacteriota archaeon]|nr:PssE/Cps14G family polysaccharide biosynthesis glycosyltransferase [Halobacteriota archaeon]